MNINKEKKDKKAILKIARLVIFVVVTLVIVWASIKYLPLISKLADEHSRIAFKEKIDSMGFTGVLAILGLQIMQIVVAVIPGQPVEIISGMVYGTWGGVLLCTVGIFIGTTLVFYIVRKLGADFIELFFSSEKIDEIKHSKLFKNTEKFEILLFIIFFIPAIPKDIFIYIGGISPIPPKKFLFISTVARIPGLFLSVYAGNKLSDGNFTISILVFAVVLIIGLIGFYVSERAKIHLESEVIDEENK